jgi:hypothetical protein
MARKKRSDEEVSDQEELGPDPSDAAEGEAEESTSLEESQVVDLVTGERIKLDESELIGCDPKERSCGTTLSLFLC